MFSTNRIVKLMSLTLAVSVSAPLLAQDQGRMQLLSRMDTNTDGVINFSEFSAMPTPAFDQQDADGDGNVSREEATEQRFARLDADGNGLLSPEEMRGARGDGQRGQGPRGQGQQGAEMRERMQNMSPEQRAQMRERMQNMTPEQRAQMRERMQNMTPEQREAMRAQMRDNGGSASAPSNNTQPNNAAHDH